LGIYQIALSVFFLLSTVTASGLPLTFSRKTAEFRTLKESRAEQGLLSSSLLWGTVVSSAFVVALYLLNGNAVVFFSDSRALPLFFILLPCLITTTLYSIIRGWLMGKKDFFTYSITEFSECIIRVILGVLFINGIVFGMRGAVGAATAFLLSDIICAVMLIVLLFAKGAKLAKPNGLKKILPNVASVTGVRLYSSAVTSLIAVFLPMQLVAAGLTQNLAVAEYGRIVGMVMPLLFAPFSLTGSLSVVLLPSAAADKAGGFTSALTLKIEKSLMLAVLFSSLFLCLYLPLGEEICRLLFNDSGTGKYLIYGAIIMLPMNINQISSSLLNSLGHEGKTLINYVLGTVLLLSSILFLTGSLGAFSLIIGLGLCYTLTAILNVRLLYKYSRFNFSFVKAMICSFVLAISIALICTLFKAILQLSDFWTIMICCVFACMFYGIFVSLLGFIEPKKLFK